MCDNPLVPEYLHTNSREPDPQFSDTELLFRHFIPGVNNEIPGDQIDIKKTSMNRGKYLEHPSDSLYALKNYSRKLEYKVFGIQVNKLRNLKIPVDDVKSKREFTFSIIHEPTTCMYPHSIILASENSIPVSEIKPNSVKNIYRIYLAEHSVIF